MEKWIMKGLKYPALVLILMLVTSLFFFSVMKNNSQMETDLDKYMPQTHPAFVYSNQAEDWFGIQDGIIIAIENKKGIYNTGTLTKIKKLTKELQKMDEIEKSDVTSLYTADNILGTEEGLDVKPFFKRIPKTSEQLLELQQSVKNNEMVYGRLVSEKEDVTIIIAEIKDDVFSQEFYKRILEVSKKYEGPDEAVYVAGRPIVEGTMALLGPKDMKKMVPIVIIVIIGVLVLVLKSLNATLFTMIVVTFSTIWTFGLMAFMKIPIYAVSTMIPVMLIAIGVADGIHIYSHIHLFMQEHPDATKEDAVRDMISSMWKPVVMTSVTTAVGFVSLLTSQVYPIKYFGMFTAFGVLMAMVFSLLLIPAAILTFGLPRWKRVEKKTDSSTSGFASTFTRLMLRYKGAVIGLTLLLILASLTGVSKVWINSSFLDKFEKNSDIVLTDKFINQNFGGTSAINVILDAPKENAFKDPKVLKVIDSMQKDVDDSLVLVGNSFSLTDYLKRMNKVMNEDQELFNTIPDSTDLVAQYLLLYEMSGDPENLWKVVDYKFKKLNLTFQIKSDDSKALNSVLDKVEEHREELEALGVSIHYAGAGYKSLVFTDLILQGQIMSIVLSLIIVIVLLGFMFKNIMVGIIGSVPIIITTFVSFGVMGLFNIPLSTTTALLSSIAIGIGIDYAVHFIERYRHYAKDSADKELVSIKTMQHSGRAILLNAVVVIAGFMVLLRSVFPPNRSLGALVSLNMFVSFVGTVTVMFVLLVMSDLYMKGTKNEKK